MADTKHTKIEFGYVASYSQSKRLPQKSTQVISQNKNETIKITHKELNENTFSGNKKVNYAEQRIREAYQRINKILGEN